MSAEELNLHGLVAEVLDGTDVADPAEITALVLARLTRADFAAALEHAMRSYVRQVISERRNHRNVVARIRKPGQSWKGDGIREGWQRRLRDPISGADGWVLRGNATYADLVHAAEEREGQARSLTAVARDLRAQAFAIREAGVACLNDLPAEVQIRVLAGAA